MLHVAVRLTLCTYEWHF